MSSVQGAREHQELAALPGKQSLDQEWSKADREGIASRAQWAGQGWWHQPASDSGPLLAMQAQSNEAAVRPRRRGWVRISHERGQVQAALKAQQV